EKIAALILESGPGELASSRARVPAARRSSCTSPRRQSAGARSERSRHRAGPRPRGRPAMAVDARLRPPRGPHADLRLRGDAGGCEGGVGQELAAGIGPRGLIRAPLSSPCKLARLWKNVEKRSQKFKKP